MGQEWGIVILKLLLLDALFSSCCDCQGSFGKADAQFFLSMLMIFPVIGFCFWAGLNGFDIVFEKWMGIHWKRAQHFTMACTFLVMAGVLIPWVNFVLNFVEKVTK